MKTLLLLVLLAGVPDGSSLVKDDPFPATAPTVTAPSAVKAGKVVKLTVSPPPSNVKGLYSVTYSWAVVPHELPGKDVGQVDDLMVDRLDGTIAWFGADEDVAKYTYTAFATYTFVNWDTKAITTKQFAVTGEVPVSPKVPPNPPPQPTPTPVPPAPTPPAPVVLPAGTFGISQSVYDSVLALSMDTGKRATTAKALAANFRGTATMIQKATVEGQTLTVQQIINDFANANATTLGSDAANWSPAFDKWADLVTAKKAALKTTNDWQTFVTEIAIGLEAVR